MDRPPRLLFFIRQNLRYFLQYFAGPKQITSKISPLDKLSTELVQQIASYLRSSSAAAFSLSCRRIYFLIGTQYIESLVTSNHERLEFLDLLERDFQNHIICIDCNKLHEIQNASKYTRQYYRFQHKSKPPCVINNIERLVWSGIHFDFSEVVFKMAIKRYQNYGHNTKDYQLRKLLNLLSASRPTEFLFSDVLRTTSTICQIKNGSLHVYRHLELYSKCAAILRFPLVYHICPHLDITTRGNICIVTGDHILPHEIKWTIILPCESGNKIMKGKSWDLCSNLQYCQCCQTEFKIFIKHKNGCSITIKFTIWKDLGQGPEYKEWRAHLDRYPSDLP